MHLFHHGCWTIGGVLSHVHVETALGMDQTVKACVQSSLVSLLQVGADGTSRILNTFQLDGRHVVCLGHRIYVTAT